MNDVYLLTGGNMGHRVANLQQAGQLIEQFAGPVVASSQLYETAAWGITDQPFFLNQVLLCQTLLTPKQLLSTILQIETTMGRTRELRFGPRSIDIDILFYNNNIVAETDLQIPHPEIANRRFVLVPLNELAPNLVHPATGKPVHLLLQECTDPLQVDVMR